MPFSLTHGAAAAALAFSPFIMAAGTAQATPFASERAAVSTSGLDLATDSGRAALDARIARAAAEVCGKSVHHLGASAMTRAYQCRQEVIAETRSKLLLR